VGAVTLTGSITVTATTSDDYNSAMNLISTANANATAAGTTPPFSNVNGDPNGLVITLNISRTGIVPPPPSD